MWSMAKALTELNVTDAVQISSLAFERIWTNLSVVSSQFSNTVFIFRKIQNPKVGPIFPAISLRE